MSRESFAYSNTMDNVDFRGPTVDDDGGVIVQRSCR
jgi:hypothetical protein